MPLEIEDINNRAIRCDQCHNIIRGKPLVVKTCCNNKPLVFCSSKCYQEWMREWMKKQEQMKQKSKTTKKLL
ncbi:hypothetical protein DFR86_05950 [Acidianus sulfidivorans JP7]|uniref:TRASH domain-containing protein n=1 Tax=Acidianus sulfidivorans JP7 TaxID=619593 RepID=A0A2U9IQM1_9CREN|nr:hypothetical protein [Acidianus sulfidivorans]AWR98257.1 hypothetical protein DFR86_05950 [Acidianus sulfidivorans JP7]